MHKLCEIHALCHTAVTSLTSLEMCSEWFGSLLHQSLTAPFRASSQSVFWRLAGDIRVQVEALARSTMGLSAAIGIIEATPGSFMFSAFLKPQHVRPNHTLSFKTRKSISFCHLPYLQLFHLFIISSSQFYLLVPTYSISCRESLLRSQN
jgi:hypothetical protein